MKDKKNENLSSLGKFIEEYKLSDGVRLHMPGHKGAFGFEEDLTEIKGADSLYEAEGVILDAEKEAASVFGSRSTFLGTEGSSQIIKAMCFLALKHCREKGRNAEHPVILASRNAHKAFIYASMLLGFDIRWMSREDSAYSLCKCELTPVELEKYIDEFNITQKQDRKSDLAAVFVTSPDYLGNMLDIKALSEVAHRKGLLFLCDNAHGAYLKLLKEDLHPLSLGADMTADSAHKTLPVLTGGAFLHVSENAPAGLEKDAKKALLMFGSTSPSYLIMNSVAESMKRIRKSDYDETVQKLAKLKGQLRALGYVLYGDEPLKLVIDLRDSALTGPGFAEELRNYNIECEYEDPDFLVTMWSPYNRYPRDTERFISALSELAADYLKKAKKKPAEFNFTLPQVHFSPRDIMFLPHKTVSVEDPSLIGKIAADAVLSCPPAVSPIIAGEEFTENIVSVLRHYGVTSVEILA